MKLFDKILLGLLSIAAVLAGITLALIALGWGIHTDLGSSAALFFGILALVLVGISVRMFFVVFHKDKPDAGVLVQNTEMGGSYMTYAALEGVVRAFVAQRPEVKGCRIRVSSAPEDKIDIGLKLSVAAGTPVAPLTASLQEALKAHVEALCGVQVHQIAVLVENAAAEAGEQKALTAPRVK